MTQIYAGQITGVHKDKSIFPHCAQSEEISIYPYVHL